MKRTLHWVLLLVGTALGAGIAGVRINLTPSLPLGFYLESESGEYVEFCPTAETQLRRKRPPGMCEDAQAPLLKLLAARAGDTVELDQEGMRVNGSLLPNSRPLPQDSAGQPLKSYPSGRYVVDAEHVWVVTDHPQSYDSRYFGPIDKGIVRAFLKPLWVVEAGK